MCGSRRSTATCPMSVSTTRCYAAGTSSCRHAAPSRSETAPRSGKDLLGSPPGHIGPPDVAAGIAIRQLLVVQPQQRQQGGMQVGAVHLSLDRLEAILV